jgi:uncharacterized repeat protein (TIGR01451 family)
MMKMWNAVSMVVVVFVLVLQPLAARAQQGDIVVTSIAEVEVKEKTAQGNVEVKRVEASKTNVAPGDTVLFTTRYINKGKKAATGVVVTNPVPEHMAYLDKSAEGKGTKIDFSIDSGKSYATAEKLQIKGKDGKVRPALAGDYTHIRWTVSSPLAPGAGGSVSFSARIK